MDSMWFLMLGHFLGDYALQSDRLAREKGNDLRLLVTHITIYVFAVAVVYCGGLSLGGRELAPPGLIIGAFAGIFVLHGTQDLIKARFHSCSRQAYYLDQALHVMQLFVVRLWLG